MRRLLLTIAAVAVVAACGRKTELPLVTVETTWGVVVPPAIRRPPPTPPGCEPATVVGREERSFRYELWRERPEPELEPPDEWPRAVQQILGEYTIAALEHRVAGLVILEVVVSADGRVAGARIVKGLPCGLERKAMDAVRQARFLPAQKDGHAVAASTSVAVHFRLPHGQPKKQK